MSINGDPKFSDISPLRRHFIYGVNCYQHAIGIKPITLFANTPAPESYQYMTLCPGNMAKSAWEKAGGISIRSLPTYILKDLLYEGCRNDGLTIVENTSRNAAIHIPERHSLIALFYSQYRSDFHFLRFNEKQNKWEQKTPLSDVEEIDSLPPIIMGDYTFSKLMIVPPDINPQGRVPGILVNLADDISLNVVKKRPHWANGPILEDRGDSTFFRPRKQILAKPYLPENVFA